LIEAGLVIFGQQVWNGAVNGVSYTLFALGLTLIFGVLRVTNIAHGEFFMLGAMVLAVLEEFFGMNFFLALICSALFAGGLGFLCHRIAIRPLLTADPLSTLLSTLAVSYILMNASILLWPFPKTVVPALPGILTLGGVRITEASLTSFALGGLIIAGLYFFLTRVRMGKEIDATSQNRVGASLTGINVKVIYEATFMLAAALAAFAGGLVGPIWQANTTMGQVVIIKGFAIVIVAGLGNVVGCLWVGLFIGIAESLFGQYVAMYYKEGFIFGIMIISMLLKPEGLFTRR
jgi:branched-chain amino acid transport system permease protein